MYQPYTITVQERQTADDGIGGSTSTWTDTGTISGFIDLVSGTDLPTGSTNNAFIEESTHVAVIPEIPTDVTVTDEHRLVGPGGRIYDVTYVDDPLGVGSHLEIYLRYMGGAE